MLIAVSTTACTTYEAFYETFIKKETQDKDIVRIGVFEALSGKDKNYGELELKGIKLAREMFPTVLGKKVELEIVDNKSDIYVSESVAKQLADEKVTVVLGSYGSANSLMAVKPLEEAGIPAIAITNTNPLVTSYNPYYFRACMLDTAQCEALTRYAIGNLLATSAAILMPEKNDYAVAMAQAFGESFQKRLENPYAVVSSSGYTSDRENLKEELLKIKGSNASVVFLPEKHSKALRIIKQARKLGLKQIFIGTDQWDEKEFIEEIQNLGGGVVFSTLFDSKMDATIMSEKFVKAYKKKYGQDSEPESAVALGFDSYLLAINAINSAGTATDGVKIKNKLAMTRALPGATGAINLDPNGDPIKSVVLRLISPDKKVSEVNIEPQFFNSLIEDEGLDGTTQILQKPQEGTI